MKRSLLLLTALIILCVSACVTPQDYVKQEEELAYYKREALAADSMEMAYQNLQLETREEEDAQRRLLVELEQLTATNISLNKSYQEILAKYNEVVNKNNDVLAVTAYENQDLQERIAAQQMELDQKEKEVAGLEYNISKNGYASSPTSYDYTTKGYSPPTDPRMQQLQAMVGLKEKKMADLRRSVNEFLTGFSNEELTITEKNGKMYISMSQPFLFGKGNEVIEYRGQKALMLLARALNQNPDIDILVEGHTDAEGTAARNWDLSVLRATAVVRALADYAVDPRRITAAGRSFYIPVASNASPQGKDLNRRTEIILSADLDELYNFLKP